MLLEIPFFSVDYKIFSHFRSLESDCTTADRQRLKKRRFAQAIQQGCEDFNFVAPEVTRVCETAMGQS